MRFDMEVIRCHAECPLRESKVQWAHWSLSTRLDKPGLLGVLMPQLMNETSRPDVDGGFFNTPREVPRKIGRLGSLHQLQPLLRQYLQHSVGISIVLLPILALGKDVVVVNPLRHRCRVGLERTLRR